MSGRRGHRATRGSNMAKASSVHPADMHTSHASNGRSSGQTRSYSSFSKMHLSDLFQRRQHRASTSGGVTETDSSRFGLGVQQQGQQGDAAELVERSPHKRGASDYSYEEAVQSSPSGSPFMPSGGNGAMSGGVSNTRRRLSSIFGSYRGGRRGSSTFFSTSGTPYDEQEHLDPLLTEIFAIPDHVAAFREALMDDEGQHEPPAMSSIWPSVGGALGKLGMGSVPGPRNDSKSPVEEEADDAASALIAEHTAGGKGGVAGQRRGGAQYGRRRQGGSIASRSSESLTRATQTVNKHPKKVGRIAAASDFAPVHERTSRRGRQGRAQTDTGSREGLLYKLVRFPLLVSIFITIALEFLAYVLIRQLVNVNEYLVAWRGHKGKLRTRLRSATTADEWREVALELDNYLDYEAWKREDASGLYDWILIKKVMHSLQTMQRDGDAEGVLNVLDLCLRNNFAGTENFHLYSETFLGTKHLIESYLVVVEEALRFIRDTDKLAPQRKRTFYRNAQKNMGRSALCLSGGACFGYYHIGVVRALLDANLLPNIITGTSAGGLIAALACTRTNEELDRLLVPELADRITACEETIAIWGPRLYKTGARFDTVKWAEKCAFFTLGSLTFAEAFARTGKVLNISVIPSDRHSPVKLLNHYTAPNCIIWSSLLASAAVPGIMNPVCLMQKTRTGEAVPWNWGHRFKDGSLRSDIPLQDLHSLFNVNYPIVSQANPHVHLFFFAPKGMPGRPVAHRKGKGWRGGFILSASEHVLKLHLSMNFKIIRDLDLLPSILGQDWSSVFLQRFSGAVTIWPKTRAWDWVRILSDPDRKELSRMIRVGASVTFPKLHMIENRVRLEKAIQEGRRENRKILRKAHQHSQHARHANTDEPRGNGARHAGAERDGLKKSYRTSGEYGSGADLSASGYPSAADGLTQSDTDGFGEDFFASKSLARGSDAEASTAGLESHADHPLTSSSPPKYLRRIQRQLAHGFSRLPRAIPAEDAMIANGSITPSDVGNAATRTGYLTPGQTTPGELGGRLPRHIRERSFSVEDGGSLYGADPDAEQHEAHAHHHRGVPRSHNDSGPSNSSRARSSLHTEWNQRGAMGSTMKASSDYEEEYNDAGEGSIEGSVENNHVDAINFAHTQRPRQEVLPSAQRDTEEAAKSPYAPGDNDRTIRAPGGAAAIADSDGSSSTSSSSGAEEAS